MLLTVERRWKKTAYTIGRLYVDEQLFCNTLEDADRGLTQSMSASTIASIKIAGETAIPTGVYTIDMDTVSPKYSAVPWYRTLCGGKMPRLLNVKGFEGILIHPGTTALDTRGCILTGFNRERGRLVESRKCFENLYRLMKIAHDRCEKITIEIR